MADAEIPTIVLTYKYRLLPTKRQHAALAQILEDQRQLYNAALEERIDCYRKTGKGRTYFDQCKSLTELRKDDEFGLVPVNVQRGTIKRVHEAFKGFFSRVRRGEKKVGFPRFRGKNWFTSFDFSQFVGITFDGSRLRFKGSGGGIRVHVHRPMPVGKILTARFKRDTKGWAVCFAMKIDTPDGRKIKTAVGVDVGIKTLAACSDGLLIPNPRVARKAARAMRLRQRALARCKRGSNRRRKVGAQAARLHSKIANTRSTALHQISATLVNRYDLIAVEALNNKGLARTMLAGDVLDASWTKLLIFLRYKAARAGAQIIEVDPRFTSQTCPDCGAVAKKTLAERTHSCSCGCVLDRDVAAAKVILSRAVVSPGTPNVARWGERALRNLNA